MTQQEDPGRAATVAYLEGEKAKLVAEIERLGWALNAIEQTLGYLAGDQPSVETPTLRRHMRFERPEDQIRANRLRVGQEAEASLQFEGEGNAPAISKRTPRGDVNQTDVPVDSGSEGVPPATRPRRQLFAQTGKLIPGAAMPTRIRVGDLTQVSPEGEGHVVDVTAQGELPDVVGKGRGRYNKAARRSSDSEPDPATPPVRSPGRRRIDDGTQPRPRSRRGGSSTPAE